MNTVRDIKNKKQHTDFINSIPFSKLPRINDIAFIKDEIAFVLDDGRIIYIPLCWSKKLAKASQKKRMNFKNNGIHIFWDDVDEIIGIKNILFGKELFL